MSKKKKKSCSRFVLRGENFRRLGAHLADAAEDLEEDAEHLFDEAEAGDFNDLDEKLIDEQLAQELEEAAQDMDHVRKRENCWF